MKDEEKSLSPPRLPTWPTASLRTYLVIVILLATVPIATLMSYQIFKQVENQRENLNADIERRTTVLAQAVNRELLSSIDALNILSFAGELQQGDIARFEQALLNRPLLRESWSGVYLVSLDGAVLFNTAHRGQPTIQKHTNVNGFLNSIRDQPAVVSNLLSDRDEGRFTTTIEVPVVVDGAIRYILGVSIPASVWQRLTMETGIQTAAVMVIIDRNFRMIARSRLAERFTGVEVLEHNRQTMVERPAGTARLESLEGGTLYASWETVPLSGWVVSVGVPAGPVDYAHAEAIAMALATAFGCLLLGVFLALIVARRMTRPLHRLASNDLSMPSERIAVREISMLRDSLVAAHTHDEITRELIRKKRDQLEKKADEFETLLASSPIGLAFAQDRLCRTVTHNAAMDALFGGDSGRIGEVMVLHEGHSMPREQQPLQRAAAYGETTTGMELEVRVEGRPPAFVIVHAVPLRDEDGQPRGAIGAVVDITERKAAEERLISAEQRLRESQHLVDLAQETGHVGFFHYQLADRILAWTPGQAKLFGIGPNEPASQLSVWTQRIDREDWCRVLRGLLMAFKRRQETATLDYCVQLPDGGPARWLSSRVRFVFGADGEPQHIIGVTVDMTEQKNTERERDALIVREQAARIEAEAANRSKDEFLAMLGHELRNPLSAIASGVEVLNRVDGGTEVAKNALRIIGRQTRHLSHMMDDLLDVARVMTGRVDLPRHPLDLGALVERVIATLRITGEFHEHELVPNIQEVWIKANATRIEQVVSNLLVNAIKYTPPGGRIEVCVEHEDGQALLEVKDNGVGISPELLPRVFDLFVQGERTLDRRAGGLGVGLTLVRRLIELHDGTIIASNANPGTIMTARLPVIEPPQQDRFEAEPAQARGRTIAIVEDNQDVIEGLSTVLKLEGHSVWTATDGNAGLALILDKRPDVSIVDIGLPGLTGYEVAQRSRAGGYPGKMIALSGYGQESDRNKALASGFDVHFLKPVTSGELLSAVARD